jgi:hypothetical protein
MTEVEEGTGAPLGGTLPPTRAAGLGVPGTSAQAQVWRLKFWNRGADPCLLGLVTAQLHHIGFPVAAALEPRQEAALVDWLKDPAHRKAAVQAYDKAVGLFRPAWAREAQGRRLANFLSLGMFSGVATAPAQPIHRDDTHAGRPFPLLQQVGLNAPESARLGWLGTGDAPLGEGSVWQDFANHYAQELPQTRTVQVPHHGAAPSNGPVFFHPGLLPEAGMRAVISVGSSNLYGHPKLSVVQASVSVGAQLAIVTEQSATPYSESCEFHV